MELTTRTPHDATRCPYCRSALRRVPGHWLGRGQLQCDRCGDFMDFSRPLTAADGDGTVQDRERALTERR
jgi:hypothetical protein